MPGMIRPDFGDSYLGILLWFVVGIVATGAFGLLIGMGLGVALWGAEQVWPYLVTAVQAVPYLLVAGLVLLWVADRTGLGMRAAGWWLARRDRTRG